MNNSNYNTNRAAQWAAEAAEADRLERQAINELQTEARAIEAERIVFGWYDARDFYLEAARTAPADSVAQKNMFRKAWAAENMAIKWGVYRYSLMNPSKKMIKAKIAEIIADEEMVYSRMDQIA